MCQLGIGHKGLPLLRPSWDSHKQSPDSILEYIHQLGVMSWAMYELIRATWKHGTAMSKAVRRSRII
jgi:hypothetical protein